MTEAVLGLEDGDVRVYLSTLSSILEVEEPDPSGDYTIVFHHSSFMDFLHTRERSKDYYVDDQTTRMFIALRVLRAFTSNGTCRWSAVHSTSSG